MVRSGQRSAKSATYAQTTASTWSSTTRRSLLRVGGDDGGAHRDHGASGPPVSTSRAVWSDEPQQLAAEQLEVAALLLLVLQGAVEVEEHDRRRVRVDLEGPSLGGAVRVEVQAQPVADPSAAGAVGELRLARVRRVRARLEAAEVLAQRLLRRPRPGGVDDDQRCVDADQARALDVRRQRIGDLVVGAHRLDVDEPAGLVEHGQPRGPVETPGEVDADVVHGVSLPCPRPRWGGRAR